MKLARMEIQGIKKSLEEVILGYKGIEEDIKHNVSKYKPVYDTRVPPIDGKRQHFQIAFNPVGVRIKQLFRDNLDPNSPYFICIFNPERQNRPKKKSQKNQNLCSICTNFTKKKVYIAESGNFELCANGFPYHSRSSMLISKDHTKHQDNLSAEDISEFIKFSILTKQVIFYNTSGAGASQKHQHAQVVDQEVIYAQRGIQYPLFMCEKEQVKATKRNSIDTERRTLGYPADALIYEGLDAPNKAIELINKLKARDYSYNVIIREEEVYVIGRNKETEKNLWTETNIGGYEILGVFILDSQEMYDHANFYNLWRNVERSCINLDSSFRK